MFHRVHLVALFIAMSGASVICAQTPETLEIPELKEPITSEVLLALDEYRNAIEAARDNAFLYEQRRAEYFQAIHELHGMELEWTVSVMKVTQTKVAVRHAHWGRTRVVMVHYTDSGCPAYGNVNYQPPNPAPPTTSRYAKHAAEPILEIGLEIPLELARTLRKDDLIKMTGHIERVDTRLPRGNSPDTLVYVANIQASRYYTEEELDAIAEEKDAANDAQKSVPESSSRRNQ